MDGETLQRMIKDALFTVKEESVLDFTKSDVEYQASCERHEKARNAYDTIRSSLTNEQRKIVDELLEATDENDTDMHDLMYMTGMRDMYLLLQSYGAIRSPGWQKPND